MQQSYQVSVRGKVYEQLKARAEADGVTVGTIVERAIAAHIDITPVERPRRKK